MAMAKTLEEKALSLPAPERAKLAERLLVSLEALSEEEVHELWLDEADRRIQQIRDGLVELVPSDEVSKKARKAGLHFGPVQG